MFSVKFPIGSTQVQAEFQDGDHVFTSSDFELGTIHTAGSPPLLGRLTLSYSYNSEGQIITICDTNYPSADGMTLITTPQDSEAAPSKMTISGDITVVELAPHDAGTNDSESGPSIARILKNLVRDANDALIEALLAESELIVQVRRMTSEAPKETYFDLSIPSRDGNLFESDGVTRKHERRHKGKLFGSTLAPKGGYKDDKTFVEGTKFVNAIGTTDDSYVIWEGDKIKSWIKLWRLIFDKNDNQPKECTSKGYKGFKCNDDNMVGGHCFPGDEENNKDPIKDGADVWIVPICGKHNDEKEKVQMKVVNGTPAVKMSFGPLEK